MVQSLTRSRPDHVRVVALFGSGVLDPELSVPLHHRDDMYAEKLPANTDRALDRSQMSRDLVDLAMMIKAWGPIPVTALKKAEGAYGRSIYDYFDRGLERLRDDRYRDECLKAMGMTPSLGTPSSPCSLSSNRANRVRRYPPWAWQSRVHRGDSLSGLSGDGGAGLAGRK